MAANACKGQSACKGGAECLQGPERLQGSGLREDVREAKCKATGGAFVKG